MQNKDSESGSKLDFSNYVYIDLEYGLTEGYIDSFQRFMERIYNACESEVTAKEAIIAETKQRLKPKNVLTEAIKAFENPKHGISKILGDHLFYKTYKMKN